MAPKHSADTVGVEKTKRKRSSLSLEVKLDILKRKEQGEGWRAIRCWMAHTLPLAIPYCASHLLGPRQI
ncbi:hypothetical protein E2C01_034537 [Portunus trituberculatus]|uniref:HTH psq-type domain-containing protein n=1 Tax=Portunus trituberculatus TaxID=210409 RepID=A0A5B7F6W8_PORTR|nr:hypothetical protein [Portunus trituberculatus]